MRAAQQLEPYRLVVGDWPEPTEADLGQDGILVRSELGAICGSDLSFYEGTEQGLSFPLAPGRNLHESIGRVVASRSERFAPGDRVLALPHDRRGMADLYMSLGATAVPVPTDVPAERLIVAQPLGTVIWGARHAESMLDRDVVILGAGPIGLLWTAMAGLHGARTVVVADRLPHRLAVARELGATATWNVDEHDGVDLVRAVTDDRLADMVIEAVGHRELAVTLDRAIRLVRKLGTIVAFGVPDAPRLTFDYGLYWRKNITLVGSSDPDVLSYLPLALQLILDGRIAAERLISHRFALEDAPAAFDLASRRTDGVLKVALTFD
jgi:threonine dehydrogenase-like Zn-dependent dehydrogenase